MSLTDRFMAFDRVRLGKSKVVADDEDELVVNAVLASEIVHRYVDGMAYKSAGELAKAAWTVEGRWIKILDHPAEGTIQRINDISGYITNVEFVKDLKDPKTGRPSRKGVTGDIHFFKHARGKDGATPVPPELVEKIRIGDLCDVSIGFTFEKDATPGEWGGMRYDYAQRNLFFDHVAAPVAMGRCPAPYCGIGADSVLPSPRLIGLDTWEEGEKYIRSGHGDPDRFDKASLRTIEITEGIKAVVGCPKGNYEGGECKVGTEVQSYLFDKGKFTMEQAKAWFEEHKGDKQDLEKNGPQSEEERAKAHFNISDEEWEKLSEEEKQAYIKKLPPRGSAGQSDCQICNRIDELGKLEFSTRLARAFGKGAVLRVVAAAGDAMNAEEIQAKIDELYKKRDELHAKEQEYSVRPDPALKKLWRQLEDIDMEIKALKALKAAQIVGKGAEEEGDSVSTILKRSKETVAKNRELMET